MMDNLNFFFINNKKQIIYGFLCVILLVSFAVRFSYNKKTNPKDYKIAQSYYIKWKQSDDEEALSDLLDILKKRPELAAKYEASIGQKLILADRAEEALPLLHHLVQRNKEILPQYYQFTEVTGLMVEEKFLEALERSLVIKETVSPDTYLYGFNLIRIANLYRQLGDFENELSSWKELREFIDSENDPNRVKRSLSEHFTQGNISLCDFISVREKELQKTVIR